MCVAGDRWVPLNKAICKKVLLGADEFFCGAFFAGVGKYKYKFHSSFTLVNGVQIFVYRHCGNDHELVIKEIRSHELRVTVVEQPAEAADEKWQYYVAVHDSNALQWPNAVAKFYFSDCEMVNVTTLRDRDMHDCVHRKWR